MKKLLALILSAVMAFAMTGAAMAEESAPAEDAAGPVVSLDDLSYTYAELFPVLEQEEYKQIWIDKAMEYGKVDEATADLIRTILLSMMESNLYGDEALAQLEEDPSFNAFDCYFINGVSQITIDGNNISGLDAEGNEVFNHTYEFVETVKADMGEEMNEMYKDLIPEEEWPTFDVYEAADADDDFKYFAFAGDTPAESYHIEFRYGASAENIAKYYEGEYAYYLSAGIPADADEEMITNCIDLFLQENAPTMAAMLTADSEGSESGETAEAPAEGESEGGESPEGESPEGESPEGESPEGESPEGEAPADAEAAQ